MLESLFTWLLLPLGAVLGWAWARRSPNSTESADGNSPVAPMGGLLAQLSSEDPDQAIAALTQVADMNSATAELHLTVGNQFRKRGEVDRALRIHEALLAHPQLTVDLRNRARFELAQDYLKAGLMDRAESAFEELASQGLHVAAALEQILAIYEQGRDWKHAIEVARRLEAAKGQSQRAVIAQYFCELAEECQREKKFPEAIQYAKKALNEHQDCVRGNLLLGALYQAQEEPAAAIKAFRQVYEQDPRFLPEVMTPIEACYRKVGDLTAYLAFLAEAKENTGSALPIVAESRVMAEQGQDAMGHLAAGLETRPSRALLTEFLQVMEVKPEVIAAGLSKPAASLRGALLKLTETSARYQCSQCGFNPRQMFWQCPTCKQWSSIAPVADLLKS